MFDVSFLQDMRGPQDANTNGVFDSETPREHADTALTDDYPQTEDANDAPPLSASLISLHPAPQIVETLQPQPPPFPPEPQKLSVDPGIEHPPKEQEIILPDNVAEWTAEHFAFAASCPGAEGDLPPEWDCEDFDEELENEKEKERPVRSEVEVQRARAREDAREEVEEEGEEGGDRKRKVPCVMGDRDMFDAGEVRVVRPLKRARKADAFMDGS